MEEAKVIAEVVKTEGNRECDFGHKVGDRFEFTLTHNPDLCTYALAALLPAIQVLLHGGSFPTGILYGRLAGGRRATPLGLPSPW